MEIRNFQELLKIEDESRGRRAVIANAGDAHTMRFLKLAEKTGLPRPVLTGVKEDIERLLIDNGLKPADYVISGCPPESAAQRAVDLVRGGEADFLMKGMLETSDFLRPIVKRENGLRTDGVMCYQAFLSVPDYPKLLLCTDGGMIPYPDLAQKKMIAANAVHTLRLLGYDCPKVAVLCCKETVDPKMPETLDAAALHRAAEAGEFGSAIVDGPLSYDICMSPEIAAEKHFSCPQAGNYDVLLFPNIHCANILVKSLIIHAKSVSAGLIAGCRVPVVAPSRGAKPEEQLLSVALATMLAGREGP